MKRAATRHLSAKGTRELLKASTLSVDREMSRKVMCDVYTLATGQALLVFENGRGLLYESREDLVRIYETTQELAEQRINPLRELLPHGEAFAANVDGLVKRLARTLKLEFSTLDRSLSSLDAVDESLRRLSVRRVQTAEVFEALTAYIGEVIRRETGGQWMMRLDGDGKTWIPWIVDAGGRQYAPTRIDKEFLEHGRSASVSAFVKGTLGARRLSRSRPM